MKLNNKIIRTWIGWETFLAISLYGTSLRALPVSYETSWTITFGSFLIAITWFFSEILRKNIKLKKKNAIFLTAFMIFTSYIIISSFWSPIEISKIIISDIFVITILFIPTITLLVGANDNTGKRWLTGVVIACGSVSLYVFAIWINASTTLYWIFSSQSLDNSMYTSDVYLSVSYSVITISIVTFIFSIYNVKWKVIFISITLLTLWLALELGGRGPIVWAATSILILGVVRFFQQKNFTNIPRKLFYRLATSIVTISAIFYIVITFDFINRLEFINRFIGDHERNYDQFSSIGARIDLKNQALSFISDSPIMGYGVFSFRVITGSLYSHNIFLDILFDIGLLGLLFFLPMFIYSIIKYWKILKYNKNPIDITIASLFIFILGANLTSGYFYWSPLMAWMSLVVGTWRSDH